MITLVPLCVRYLMNNDMDTNLAISDSLKVEQNKDGTFTLEWDKDDPTWKFLNELTSKEITAIIEQAIKMGENEPL